MQSAIFNTPVIKIESLKTKFDTLVLSNSFITLIGDYVEAHFFQQLHYWSLSEYGVVIDDTRWIYKPLREWLSEVFSFLTEWKLRKAIASLLEKGLIERKKLYVKHHEIKHDNPYWNPKNQTYYYSVNYDELQKRIDRVEGTKNAEAGLALAPVGDASFPAETTENVRIEDFTKLSIEDSLDTKCCELSQNKTDITSIENNSKTKSHPHLPCECETKKKENNQEQKFSNLVPPKIKEVNSVNPQTIAEDTNIGQVEENINQNINTTLYVESTQVEPPEIKSKTPKGTKSNRKHKNQAPWKDEGQFKRFYRALIQALPIVANARSPQGLAQVIIRQLRSGIPHTYWDDFVAGLPIGASTKPEWEVEPGVPYPMFIEYLTEKIIRGNNTQSNEQARNEVFRILDQPRQAIAFWGQFKRSVVNVSQAVERDRALGVSNPNTPVWTHERIEPSIDEAISAGKKITAANGDTVAAIDSVRTNPQLEAKLENNSSTESSVSDPWTDSDAQPTLREMAARRKIKGFVKAMPLVSQSEAEARKLAKPKTNISQMSVAEINDYLTDPILRAQLTPQLIDSNYELITDYLGQIIAVKAPPLEEE